MIIIASTFSLIKSRKCASSPQGLLILLLISFGYLKYLFFICAICGHCLIFRRAILSEAELNIPNSNEFVNQVLSKYKTTLKVSEDCPICLSSTETEGVALSCGHTFHSSCLKNWIFVKGSCPICRKSLH
jgi:hypothetical protein